MENTATETPVAEMKSASTEISNDASAKVDAFAAKDRRSRAFVLREIIHAWAEKQPTPRVAKKA